MSAADDLAAAFGRVSSSIPGDLPQFRQGVATAFDAVGGTNTITIAGGVALNNVSLLDIGGVAAILPGDIVQLVRLGTTWFILGRVVPMTTNVVAPSEAYVGVTGSATGWSSSTSSVTKVTATVNVPPWATKANVLALANWTVRAKTADFAQVQVTINGTSGGSNAATATAVSQILSLHASATRTAFTVTPGGSFTVTSEIQSGVAWATDAVNIVNLDGQVTFLRA